VGNQPNLAAPHTPLPSYSWIAKCPFGGRKKSRVEEGHFNISEHCLAFF
jgi:hypothetical protein